MKDEPLAATPAPAPPAGLSPPLAALLALLLPGAGHLALGRRQRAATFFIVVALIAGVMCLLPTLLSGPVRRSGLEGFVDGLATVLVFMLAEAVLAVAGLTVWLTQVIDAAACARWARRGARGQPPQPAALRFVRRGPSPVVCTYCHGGLEGEPGAVCVGCLARHHAPCWEEHGACAACGGRTRFTGTAESPGPAPRDATRAGEKLSSP